jgi:hypothetical protein
MPHRPKYNELTRMVRQLREALELTRSTNFRFLSFATPGHFYSPIPDYGAIESGNHSRFEPLIKELPGLNLNLHQQLDLIERFSEYQTDIPWPAEGKNAGFRYHFDNIYFSYGDAVALFCLMREFKPKRVLEVGSGFSSAAMLDIDDLFLNKTIEFTFVDPYAHRLMKLISDEDLPRIRLIKQPVQQIPDSEFRKLKRDDILFIDSSHVSKTGSDVGHLVHRVIPGLASGVIIHIHDIFWPFEYPKKWLKTGRAWNEAYLLLAFLQFNSAFDILFFNSYLELHHKKLLRRKLPLILRQSSSKMTYGNSSLWIRKR